MNDREIREAIKLNYKDNIFADEVNMGRARVDLLDLTQELHGIEIKGDGDNYSRLKNQVKNYGKYLSRITVYVGETKRHSIQSVVPDYWGIVIVYKCPVGRVQFEEIRPSYPNPYFDKKIAITNLWKRELVDTLCTLYNNKQQNRYLKMRRWKLASLLDKEINSLEAIEVIRTWFLTRLKSGEWR